jgi:outer membrane lipoprotein LolB
VNVRLPRAAWLAVLLALAGCAPQVLVKPVSDWSVRRAQLQALPGWSLSGRVAVAAADRGFSARLEWLQAEAASRIDLAGPFGAGALRVEVAGTELTVRDGDGGVVAAGAGALVERLGFDLPVRELRYWMLGVPAPADGHAGDVVEVLGREGRPVAFKDGQWWVHVESWTPVAGDVLPRRLVIERPGLKLKLVIDSWRLDGAAP